MTVGLVRAETSGNKRLEDIGMYWLMDCVTHLTFHAGKAMGLVISAACLTTKHLNIHSEL